MTSFCGALACSPTECARSSDSPPKPAVPDALGARSLAGRRAVSRTGPGWRCPVTPTVVAVESHLCRAAPCMLRP